VKGWSYPRPAEASPPGKARPSRKPWALLAAIAVSPLALSGTESAHADPLVVVEGQSLDVRADHLEVDIAKGTAVLQGHVHAVLGELEVECGKIDVRYDEAPVVRYARGSNDVTVRLKGIEAKAAALEVDVARRSVRLQGGVKVSRGRGWVTAEAAQIDIATRHVTLDDVKGSIPVQAPAR
jgi:lipopolysaccharide export system protein LptA